MERCAVGYLIEPRTAANYRNSLKIIGRHLADTVAKAHRLIKQVLESATDSGHIRRNPIP